MSGHVPTFSKRSRVQIKPDKGDDAPCAGRRTHSCRRARSANKQQTEGHGRRNARRVIVGLFGENGDASKRQAQRQRERERERERGLEIATTTINVTKMSDTYGICLQTIIITAAFCAADFCEIFFCVGFWAISNWMGYFLIEFLILFISNFTAFFGF